MANPWDKYATQPAAQPAPWDKYASAPAEQPNMIERLGQDWQRRSDEIGKYKGMIESGQLNPVGGAVGVYGQAAGMVGDVGNEALQSVINTFKTDQPVGIVGNVFSAIGKGAEAFGQTPIAQAAAKKAAIAKENYKNLDPNITVPLGGVINTAANLPIAFGASKAGAPIASKAVGMADDALGKTIRPTAAQLKNVSQQNYKLAEQIGGTFTPDVTDDFINKAASFRPKNPMAAAISGKSPIDDIASELEAFRGQPLTLDAATSIDQAITKRLSTPGFQENGMLNAYGQQLLEMKDSLRDALETAAAKGRITSGSAEGVEAYKQAVKDWSAQSQMREIESILERADTLDNPTTAIKAGFRNIANNPKRLKKFSKEAQVAIKNAAKDKAFAEFLRTEMGSRLISTMVGGMTGAAGGPIGSIAGAAAGAALSGQARNLAKGMKLKQVDKIKDAIAAKSSIPTRKLKLSDVLKGTP